MRLSQPVRQRQPMRHLALGLVALTIAGLALAACGSDDQPGDKKLTVYSGRVGVAGQADSGSVPVERAGSRSRCATPTARRWRRSCWRRARSSPADVFLSQDAGALGAVAKQGLFATLPSDVLAKVPATYQSSTGQWVGVTGRSRVLVYNADQVPEAELPRSVDELTGPAVAGQGRRGADERAPSRRSLPRCGSSTATSEAKQFLVDLKANGAQIRDNNVLIVQDVAGRQARRRSGQPLLRLRQGQGARDRHRRAQGQAALLPRRRHRGAGQRLRRRRADARPAPTRTRAPSSTTCSAVTAQTYFAEQTFEYPLVAGVPTAPGLPELSSLEAPDDRPQRSGHAAGDRPDDQGCGARLTSPVLARARRVRRLGAAPGASPCAAVAGDRGRPDPARSTSPSGSARPGWDRVAEELFTTRTGRAGRVAASPWPPWSPPPASVLGVASAFLVTRTDLPAGGPSRSWPRCRWPCRPTSPASPGCPRWMDFTGLLGCRPGADAVLVPVRLPAVAAALAGADPAQEEVARSLGRRSVAYLRPGDAAPDPARGGGRCAARRAVRAVRLRRGLDRARRRVHPGHLHRDEPRLRPDRRARARHRCWSCCRPRCCSARCSPGVAEPGTPVSAARAVRPPGHRLAAWRWPAVAAMVAVGRARARRTGAEPAAVGRGGVSRARVRWPRSPSPAGNSLWVSASGAALTLLLALPIGLLAARAPGPVATRWTGWPTCRTPCPAWSSGCRWCSSASTSPIRCTRRCGCSRSPTRRCSCRWRSAWSARRPRRPRPPWRRWPGRWAGGPSYVLRTVTLPLAAPGIGAGDGAGLPDLHEGTAGHPAAAPHRVRHARHRAVDATPRWPPTRPRPRTPLLLVLVAAVPTWWLSTRTGAVAHG